MKTVPQLDTTSAENLLYTTSELRFTLLGGIRLEGLDRMRVTLKIEVVNRKLSHYLNHPDIAALALRHNLDLYNDTQVEKLIRKTADKLEVGSIELTKDIADLTNQLEGYRLQQLESTVLSTVKEQALTVLQIEAAKEFLSAPNLLQRTGAAIGESGVIGEEQNRLLMYLVFTSRKMNKPLHIISFGSSGMGKSHLQESVGELFPENDKIEITSLTENAFYYFDKEELGHKLLLIEDLDGALTALYPLRELQSKQRISKTITIKDSKGNTKTIHLKVNGPVTIAGCTTKERIYEDNANRSFLIYLDESAEQDERIMAYQRAQSAGTIHTEKQRQTRLCLQHCQTILQNITVKNPFAESLKIPQEVFKPRRSNAHYLAFIEAVTFYHQYQRRQQVDKETGELFIETTLQDIQEANELLKEVLLRKSDELSGGCRNYVERLKNYLHEKKETVFTNADIKNALHLPVSTVKRYHAELLQSGQLKKVNNKESQVNSFELIAAEAYQALQSRIGKVLDEILQELQQQESTNNKQKTTRIAQSPKAAQNRNGRRKVSGSKEKLTSPNTIEEGTQG